jgi:type III secretory pathway component EscS
MIGYALLDPEFWLVLFIGAWPVIVALLTIGFIIGFLTGKVIYKDEK